MLGVLLTAIMLFPLYWMINVSLTRRAAIRDGGPLSPVRSPSTTTARR